MLNELIQGKDNTKNVVSVEVCDTNLEIFTENNGIVSSKFIPNTFWLLASSRLDDHFKLLKGDLHFKYIKTYNNVGSFYKDRKKYKERDIYCISDSKEAALIYNGITYFKSMKVEDVSVLAFDIESMGLQHNNDSRVFIISNTYRNGDNIIRKMFCCDEYESDADMFNAWCKWVREINPSIILGYNIFGYDLPYLNFCAEKAGVKLNLGRDNSALKISTYPSKFRKDGSQEYEYFRATIYGREIIDVMFTAYKYDYSRKYKSYALKQVVKQEGLEMEDRQFYDASQIAKNWHILEEREKIKKYAEHDADDAGVLFDLMIPSFFYLTQSVPKSFAAINYTATGSQLNSFLIRSYLQIGHSIPKADEVQHFAGAISLGNFGNYKNCWKVDVSSLYPSIMLQYEIYDKQKDPLGHFYKMVEYFTNERLANKKKAKETGDIYYKDLEQSQKICVNSAYGLLGAVGLNFNSVKNASFVTETGRELLQFTIEWATGKSE